MDEPQQKFRTSSWLRSVSVVSIGAIAANNSAETCAGKIPLSHQAGDAAAQRTKGGTYHPAEACAWTGLASVRALCGGRAAQGMQQHECVLSLPEISGRKRSFP